MVPLVELRGSMIMASGWHLPFFTSLLICVIGNMVPIPFIYLFAHRVLLWGQDKPLIGPFFRFCIEKGHSGGRKLEAKAGKGIFWALFLFVAIPLPGTGAWTGTLAASILDLGFKKSIIACLCGVIFAGILIGVLSHFGFSVIGI
ncbi:COG2426 family protein [Eremococcus coleocola]|uniref:Putative small multi-drug export protein n=1 Tax=Eremococcus coleocola ACS-139-V-Col8 TaxID=908337 RepID=E4KM45_9LACT|nr:small multi-drug export protein [Eremococcus coleocola]EFR32127.1 putative small multi-drug export protein [Eremococcus coleocola ACS-139-V-Col8]